MRGPYERQRSRDETALGRQGGMRNAKKQRAGGHSLSGSSMAAERKQAGDGSGRSRW